MTFATRRKVVQVSADHVEELRALSRRFLNHMPGAAGTATWLSSSTAR